MRESKIIELSEIALRIECKKCGTARLFQMKDTEKLQNFQCASCGPKLQLERDDSTWHTEAQKLGTAMSRLETIQAEKPLLASFRLSLEIVTHAD